MITFKILKQEKLTSTIELYSEPSESEYNLLERFLERKRGSFVTSSKKVFTIMRKINEAELEKLFKENHLPFVCYESYLRLKKASKEFNLPSVDKKELERHHSSYMLTFGKYKNELISTVPDEYVKWLKDEHFDKNIREIAKLEHENRNVVYINI